MIYIQATSDGKLPHHFDAASALYGAIDTVQDFRLTTFEELVSGRFDFFIKKHLFVGSTEFMSEVFKRIGGIDVRLPINSNRPHKILTLGEVKDLVKLGNKVFIKPLEIKLFTGFVMDQMKFGCLNGLSDSVKVMCYEPFNYAIESEYRIYIHNNKIVDSRNYAGDFYITPDYAYVKNVVANNTNFPCAYTIDIGILSNGENVVVEFNDMWAIGNYGMENFLYLTLLKDRYFEIVRSLVK